ncbi:MAG: endonuclease/exonuclease/phosphatase family protein [bacterium]|nr:endonuclease/exonuclease/phosphatase family protein [bacterium]
MYANILWTNTDYTGIENMIDSYDPDVLMFVEFASHHYRHLYDFLSERYPFVNRATWSQSLMVGSMVFSKYPIDNLVEQYPQ